MCWHWAAAAGFGFMGLFLGAIIGATLARRQG